MIEQRTTQEVITILRGAAQGKLPPNFNSGICRLVHHLCGRGDLRVDWLARGWPKHSGSNNYPVPHPKYPRGPESAYYQEPKWEGEYGDNRRELCAYIADKLEQRL